MRVKNLGVVILAVLLVAASASPVHSAAPSTRKLYKWVDAQGITHYGDQVPPEFASQEQHVVNAQGIETEHIDAQKSPEQMAADEQKRAEAEQRASRDKNLLNTYSSVAEIERLRDQRLALVSDQIKVKGQFLEILTGQMDKLRSGSMRFRPYNDDPKAPPMTDQIAEDLVRVHNDIHTQEDNLREKQREAINMHKQFDNDVARFKELRGIH